MKNITICLGLVAAALLGACGSEAEVTPGLELPLEARNLKARPPLVAAPAVEEGGQTFRTAEDIRIDLQAGYINLLPLELVEDCGALAALRLPELIGSAWAHEGHGSASGGLINVAVADDTAYALGLLAPAPGSYCGLRVALAPIVASKHGGAVTARPGALVSAFPCHYPQSAGVPDPASAALSHECVEVAAGGGAEATLRFAQPLLIAAAGMPAALHVRVHYDTWFDGLDIPQLAAGDAGQQQLLVQNVLTSLEAVALAASAP